MKCPQCGELILRWFTYHTCGWRKPGISAPVETKEPKVVPTVPSKTLEEFNKEVEKSITLEDIYRTMENLVTYMAKIEQIAKATLENQSAILAGLQKILKVHGETIDDTLRR